MRSVIAVVIALSCAGCGSASAVDGGRSTAPPYKGPLTAVLRSTRSSATAPSPSFVRPASTTTASRRSSRAHRTHSTTTSRSPASATACRSRAIASSAATRAMPCSRTTSVIAPRSRSYSRTGSVTGTMTSGWGVVAWAQCDPAEFPAEVTDDLGIGVWEDASGRRVPVTRVLSRQGPEHCSWTDITFLLIGPDDHRADWYVRDATGEFPRRCSAARSTTMRRCRRMRPPPAGAVAGASCG